MQAYRLIAHQDYHSVNADPTRLCSDIAVLHQLEAPPPELLLMMARILLFLRIVAKQPPMVMELLLYVKDMHESWLHYIQDDLFWLSNFGAMLECQRWDLDEWVKAIKANPIGFKK